MTDLINGWTSLAAIPQASVLIQDSVPVRVAIVQEEHECSISDRVIEIQIKAELGADVRVAGGVAAWDRGEKPGEAVARLEPVTTSEPAPFDPSSITDADPVPEHATGDQVIAVALDRRARKAGAQEVSIIARKANYNSRGIGSAEHRRVLLPGSSSVQWASEAGECTGSYDKRNGGTERVLLPEGTLIVAYDTETTKRGKGRAVLSGGIVVRWIGEDGKEDRAFWGLTARRKGEEVILTLPDGTKHTF